MSDLIQAPFVRNQYDTTAGLDNPLYIGDIVASQQAIYTMLTALSGLDPATDFGIFGGFAYSPGSPGTYGPGFFYLNGVWYYQSTSFDEGLRLVPNPTDIMPVSFPADGITRDIYKVNYSQTGTGATQTPVFAVGGDMSQYRYDNKTLKTPAYVWSSWTVIGSGGGAPSYGTNFTSPGGGVLDTQFRKDTNGNVELFLQANQGTGGSDVVFTLPAGYRPSTPIWFTYGVGSAYGTATKTTYTGSIGTDGSVNVNSNTSGGGIGILATLIFPTA